MTDLDAPVIDDLPEDWVHQVFRAYETFGVDPLDGADELALFGGKLDPKMLAEKAKKQLRDVEGKFREMRARIGENIDQKIRTVTGKDKPPRPRVPDVDTAFEPPRAAPPEVEKPGESFDTPKNPRTDVYKGWERDAAGRVIIPKDIYDEDFAVGDHSMTAHMEDSVDAAGNPVKVLSKEREEFHREMVHRVFDGVPKSKRAKALAIFMGGGPGAGKTSATKTVADFPRTREMKDYDKKAPGEAALIDADGFKVQFPEWGSKDPAAAAMFTHSESSLMARLSREEGVRQGTDMVIDGTGDNSPAKMKSKIDEMKNADPPYDVAAMYVTTPASEAMARAAARGASSGRKVPMHVVDSIHKGVTTTFEGVKGEFGDAYDLYDADVPEGAEGVPIIRDGKVVDQARYDAFLAKTQVDLEDSLREAITKMSDPSRKVRGSKTKTSDEIRAEAVDTLEQALRSLLEKKQKAA